MTEIDTLKSKAAKQTTEIARLTQKLERTTAETIRRRLLLSALNDEPGWRDDAILELGVLK
jgi:hypothetical protein